MNQINKVGDYSFNLKHKKERYSIRIDFSASSWYAATKNMHSYKLTSPLSIGHKLNLNMQLDTWNILTYSGLWSIWLTCKQTSMFTITLMLMIISFKYNSQSCQCKQAFTWILWSNRKFIMTYNLRRLQLNSRPWSLNTKDHR